MDFFVWNGFRIFVIKLSEMETITIKINPRSKAGKLLKEMLEVVYSKLPGIEIVQEESPYNPEFVKKIKRAEKRGDYIEIDPKNVWDSI